MPLADETRAVIYNKTLLCTSVASMTLETSHTPSAWCRSGTVRCAEPGSHPAAGAAANILPTVMPGRMPSEAGGLRSLRPCAMTCACPGLTDQS